ncbi:MAG TPA: hypothetical protein VI755_00455 [Anaerolineales bacterium]|nr:hypothetical protein [Anaerolineales bacterium]
MKVRTDEIMREQRVDLLIAILVFGSLWGLSEVVLGSAIRAAGLPYRAGILTGVGMGIMGMAIGIFRKPVMLAGIALVAILCKQLAVPILHASVMCEANSCLAVMLEGLALAGVVSLAGRKLDRGYLIKIVSGALAALLVAAAFFFIGMQVAPCRYLLSFNRPGGFMAFLAVEGLVWAAFSATLFPLGYWAGARLRDVVPVFGTRKPWLYITSAALVVCSWVASALAIATGL